MQQEISDAIQLNTNNEEKEEEESKQQSNDNINVDHIEETNDIVTIEDKLDLNDNNGEEWSKYKLMTWNLWTMPVSSPRCLSNPDRCSTYLRDLADKQDWKNYDGLIVVAIQELWNWKTGIFPPFLLRLVAFCEYIPYIGRFFAAFFTMISILLGILPILKCFPIQYNPKSRFINKLRHYLPFAMENHDIPLTKFMDNGLVTLTNKRPTKWGFQPYDSSACNDSLANKGWLWTYYEHQRFMLINTHMQAAGAGQMRLLQIRELKAWIEEEWESPGFIDKCVIIGDFNVDMESHPIRVQQYNIQKNKKQPVTDNNNNNDDVKLEMDIDAYILEEIGNDELTILNANCKESLADNLRKLRMAQEGGKKTKFTKKAYMNIPHHLGPRYHKLNRYEPTFKRAEYNIDHIFANFNCDGVTNDLLAIGRYKLSDHMLVISEFTTH